VSTQLALQKRPAGSAPLCGLTRKGGQLKSNQSTAVVLRWQNGRKARRLIYLEFSDTDTQNHKAPCVMPQ